MLAPLREMPRGPVTVADVVVVPFPLLVEVPEAVVVPPCGPVTVALPVVVPLPLLVVVPLAVVVPPFGPLMVADSVVPVRVFVRLPWPLTVLPDALVAVPLAETVVPFCTTAPLAVPPRRPVTVCCATSGESTTDNAIAIDTELFFMMPLSLFQRAALAGRSRKHGYALLLQLSRAQLPLARLQDTSLHFPAATKVGAGIVTPFPFPARESR